MYVCNGTKRGRASTTYNAATILIKLATRSTSIAPTGSAVAILTSVVPAVATMHSTKSFRRPVYSPQAVLTASHLNAPKQDHNDNGLSAFRSSEKTKPNGHEPVAKTRKISRILSNLTCPPLQILILIEWKYQR